MAPHGAGASARSTEIPLHEQEIDHRLDVGHTVDVLRQSHGPANNRSVGIDIDPRGFAQSFLRDTTLPSDVCPRDGADVLGECLETHGASVDELRIEY